MGGASRCRALQIRTSTAACLDCAPRGARKDLRSRIDPDADLPAAVIPAAVLNEVFAHAREEEPEECCGLITGDDRVRHRRVVRCRNDMTLHHRRDPAAYPRDGGEAVPMNQQDYLAARGESGGAGEKIHLRYYPHLRGRAAL